MYSAVLLEVFQQNTETLRRTTIRLSQSRGMCQYKTSPEESLHSQSPLLRRRVVHRRRRRYPAGRVTVDE